MRYLTAGESHGPCLTAIIEGMPAKIPVSRNKINSDLARRQSGYGRGGRMKIEKDQVEILSGIRHGQTLGSPITLQIANKDWENWQEIMSPDEEADETGGKNNAAIGEASDNLAAESRSRSLPKEIDKVVTKARPGHADLSGAFKYRHHEDMRNVLERASARETAARVAVGSVAKALLEAIGVSVLSQVVNIGGVQAGSLLNFLEDCQEQHAGKWLELSEQVNKSPVFCLDDQKTAEMMAAIDKAKQEGDSLGGVVEVVVLNLPPGLGSYVHWDRKLDAKIAYGLTGIQAIKGVEFGLGFKGAYLPGSQVHDPIYYNRAKGFFRDTNGAGGIEGGMSNGEPVVVRAVMKPIPTLYKPLASVDIKSKEPCLASVERSDICAVPACSVVAEAVVAWEIAQAVVEKFGGDSLAEIKNNLASYRNWLQEV